MLSTILGIGNLIVSSGIVFLIFRGLIVQLNGLSEKSKLQTEMIEVLKGRTEEMNETLDMYRNLFSDLPDKVRVIKEINEILLGDERKMLENKFGEERDTFIEKIEIGERKLKEQEYLSVLKSMIDDKTFLSGQMPVKDIMSVLLQTILSSTNDMGTIEYGRNTNGSYLLTPNGKCVCFSVVNNVVPRNIIQFPASIDRSCSIEIYCNWRYSVEGITETNFIINCIEIKGRSPYLFYIAKTK